MVKTREIAKIEAQTACNLLLFPSSRLNVVLELIPTELVIIFHVYACHELMLACRPKLFFLFLFRVVMLATRIVMASN